MGVRSRGDVGEPLAVEGFSLGREALWLAGGNVVYAASQWTMLVVLARLGSVELVGRFAFALAMAGPIMIFFGLQLRSVLATDASGRFGVHQYLIVRVALLPFALATILVALTLGGHGVDVALVVLLVGAAKGVESLSDILHGFFQRLGHIREIGVSAGLKGLVSVIFFSSAVWGTESLVWAVIALGSGWACVLVVYDVPRARRLWHLMRGGQRTYTEVRSDLSFVGPLLAWSLPLGISATLLSLQSSVPRYLIERVLGEASVGVFAAMAYFVIAGSTVTIAFGHAAMPRLADYFAVGARADFVRLLLKLMLAAATVGGGSIVVSAVIGPEVLTVVYGESYAENPQAFLILMVGGCASYVATMFSMTLLALGRFRLELLTLSSAAVALIVSSLVLIDPFGLEGAASAFLFCSCVHLVVAGALSWMSIAKHQWRSNGECGKGSLEHESGTCGSP